MKKDFIVNIEDDILSKFAMALQLTGEDVHSVMEDFMKDYISKSFSNVATLFSRKDSVKFSQESFKDENYGKALRKISKWANNPSQINHKIVRAYLQLAEESELVSYDALKRRCSDNEGHPDVYISTFDSNFAQMKFDGDKSHGKVFEVDDTGYVTIWFYVEDEIMRYKEKFLLHSTDYGFINKNRQKNIGKTNMKGTDYMQKLYKMQCQDCGYEYYANGSDIHLKKCPKCQGGAETR